LKISESEEESEDEEEEAPRRGAPKKRRRKTGASDFFLDEVEVDDDDEDDYEGYDDHDLPKDESELAATMEKNLNSHREGHRGNFNVRAFFSVFCKSFCRHFFVI
jgi:hypothetical protein